MIKFEQYILSEKLLTEAADQEAARRIRWAYTNILTHYPFFARLLVSLRIREDNSVPTMATDGISIVYNSEFTKSLSGKEIVFVLCHEILHNTLGHFVRKRPHPELWNIAADYALNQLLEGMDPSIAEVPEMVLLPGKNTFPNDARFKGKNAEFIYDSLFEEFKEKAKKEVQKTKDPNFDNIKPGDIVITKSGDVIKVSSAGKPDKNGKQADIKGQVIGRVSGKNIVDDQGNEIIPENFRLKAKMFMEVVGDQIIISSDDIRARYSKQQGGQQQGGQQQGDLKRYRSWPDEEQQGGFNINDFLPEDESWNFGGVEQKGSLGKGNKENEIYSPDKEVSGEGEGGEGKELGDKENDSADLAKDWKNRAANASKNPGNIPGNLKTFLKKFLEPTVNWKAELRRFIDNIASKIKYEIPYRRFIHRGIYIPGPKRQPEIGNAVFAIDTSGSVSDKQLESFASEIKSITGNFLIPGVDVLDADVSIQHHTHYKNIRSIQLKKFEGRGGTAFKPAFDWVDKNITGSGKKLGFMIYFTDGQGDFPPKVPYADKVLWVITNDSEGKIKVPWGKRIDIISDESNK
jgi:predicted metal-dependent peptidase